MTNVTNAALDPQRMEMALDPQRMEMTKIWSFIS